MTGSRYSRLDPSDHDDADSHDQEHTPFPSSPPPAFSSRPPSPRSSRNNADRSADPLLRSRRELADAFGADTDDDDDPEDEDFRHRAIAQSNPVTAAVPSVTPPTHSNSAAAATAAATTTTTARRQPTQMPQQTNDGVFANLTAHTDPNAPEVPDKPPTYDEAAADRPPPPYWDTPTIVTTGVFPDEVYIQNLPVGSIFSFLWNAVISMSFQLVGFLLTYLLHTSHAARCGSKVGLGITLIQYGFAARGAATVPGDSPAHDDPAYGMPANPNDHNFDPSMIDTHFGFSPSSSSSSSSDPSSTDVIIFGVTLTDWVAYALMLVGWFIVVHSSVEYLKKKRQEQLVRQSPSAGDAAQAV